MSGTRLRGKTILITGASSGIGRAIALEFAQTCPDGDLKLIVTARRLAPLEELARTITDTHGGGVEVLPYSLDVSDRTAVTDFISNLTTQTSIKTIDILVNNAGLARGRARAPDIAYADLQQTIDTNILGLIHMTQAVLPMMLSHPSSNTHLSPDSDSLSQGQGDIINIGSAAGRHPYAGGSVYCASKAALTAFTDSLRRELVATRVRINQIDPGQVEQTEFTTHRLYGDSTAADAFYANQQSLVPRDVAEVVVFAATRRQNMVLADCVVYPNHQAAADVLHK